MVQRRGVPQAEAVAARFGQETLGPPAEISSLIQPSAKVTWVDQPAMGGLNVGALAANRSMIQLINPSGTNTDLYIKRVWVSLAASGGFTVRIHNTALTTLSTSVNSMIRQEGSSQVFPVGQIRSVQGAVVGTAFGSWGDVAGSREPLALSGDDSQHFDGLILQPGRGILFAPDGDNLSIRVTYHWFERLFG